MRRSSRLYARVYGGLKMSQEERLQKFLSQAGIASRRKSEDLIRQGRVSVNGSVVTEMGTKVVPGRSKVEVDGKAVFWQPARSYVAMYKPTHYITTLSDPEGRATVVDLLPASMPRVVPVGRLDWDSEGLLLLTNDGDLAHALQHPSFEVPRVYHVKVKGEVKDDSSTLETLKEGVRLEDGKVKPTRVAVVGFTGKHSWIEVELHEGRNRLVRRMCEAVGHPVLKLKRVSFGTIPLGVLKPGNFRDLSEEEVISLYEMCELNLRERPPYRGKPGKGATSVRGQEIDRSGKPKRRRSSKKPRRSSKRPRRSSKKPGKQGSRRSNRSKGGRGRGKK